MMHQVKLIQIFYDESQRQHLNQNVAHYFNGNITNAPCLENHAIANIVNGGFGIDSKYLGILSWAFERKRALRIDNIVPKIDDSADVFAFDSSHTKPNVWVKAEQWHKGITGVARECFFELGWQEIATTFTKIETPNIYSNAFITKSSIYQVYVNEWLVPFMGVLVNLESAKTNANYKAGKATPEWLERTTGYPYYTLMPFVCERLFSTYLAYNKYLTIKHLA